MSKTPKERYTEQGKKFFGCWLDEDIVAKIKSEAANRKMIIPDLIASKFMENEHGEERIPTRKKQNKRRRIGARRPGRKGRSRAPWS